ncbi:MAG: hypothetical protein K0R25_403 [Rickettsiaceae bacterium]|jgi:hypothetical protein|nr:hypothetical protein [Rickettsiaceae bacterium]
MSKEIVSDHQFKEITTTNGLFCQFEEESGVLFLDIKNPLSKEDFATIENIVDPYYQQRGELRGVIINSKKFPYWTGPQNKQEYLNFAQNNHHKFAKAALNMGGFFIRIILRLAKGRVHPEVKMFGYNKIEKAQSWILFD